MINNGFVDKSAITFTMEEANSPFSKVNDEFILFQYDVNFPEVKYVWLNGDVVLPPYNEAEDIIDIDKYQGNVAIMGNQANSSVPVDYTLIGQFNTPNSYILNSETWLISNEVELVLKNGTYFKIVAPNDAEESILNKLINDNTISIIDNEVFGSYALNSNTYVNKVGLVSLVFLTLIFILICYILISREKALMGILYLSGYPFHSVFNMVFKYKIIPYLLQSTLLITTCLVIEKGFPLWSNSWIFNSLYMFVGFSLFLLMFFYKEVFSYTVKRGGKKF